MYSVVTRTRLRCGGKYQIWHESFGKFRPTANLTVNVPKFMNEYRVTRFMVHGVYFFNYTVCKLWSINIRK